jgi:hypothetical protein
MVLTQSIAKRLDVMGGELPYIVDLLHGETVAFLELHLPKVTQQINLGMCICAHNVNMRWGMIVEVNHDLQATVAQDGWHGVVLPKTIRLFINDD